MRRRIFLWMGLSVLFTTLVLSQNGLAKDVYKVQRGDTLYSIAQKVGVEITDLKKANRLSGNSLKVNQILVVPALDGKSVAKAEKAAPAPVRAETYQVRKGDTLSSIAKKTGVSLASLSERNDLRSNRLKIGQRLVLSDKRNRLAPERESVPEGRVQNALVTEPGEEEEDGGLLADSRQGDETRQQESEALLGNWNTPEEPKLLAKVAMGFLGAPYRLGGSTVKGIDCSAFVKKIYNMFNIELPRTAFEQSRVGMRVSRNDLTVGDLLFFKTKREVGHVGIYVGNNEFVHASSRKRGVRVDNLDTPYYDKRFVRAVRLKDMDGSL